MIVVHPLDINKNFERVGEIESTNHVVTRLWDSYNGAIAKSCRKAVTESFYCVVVYYVIVIFPLFLSLTGLFVLFLIFAFDVPCTRNPYLRVG